MIAANQFFRDEFPAGENGVGSNGHGHNNNSHDAVDRFVQVSTHSFLLGREEEHSDSVGNRPTNNPLFNNIGSSDSATAARMMATMDEFLTRQSTMMQSLPSISNSLLYNGKEQQQYSNAPAWLATLEPLLRHSQLAGGLNENYPPAAPTASPTSNGFLTSKFSRGAEPRENKTLLELAWDRQGVVISKPWCLSAKTPRILPQPTTHGFCLSVFQPQQTQTKADIEFNIYAAEESATDQTTSSTYAPLGYENFSLVQDGSADVQQGSDIVYVMEIASTQKAEGEMSGHSHHHIEQQNCTELESMALVFYDDNEQQQQQAIATNARGVHVKLITSDMLMQAIHEGQQQQPDPKSLVEKLRAMDSLPLPLAVGSSSSQQQQSHSTQGLPSVIALVTFGGTATDNEDDLSDVIRAHLVMKFRRQEMQLNNPLKSNISLSHFCIGRSVHISIHGKTETEMKQKMLQLALRNAERFVPQWKREQWDDVPDALIIVDLHQDMPWKWKSWLLDPQVRRSLFDLALANVLLYLPPEFHPPNLSYFDKHTISQGSAFNQIINWRNTIVGNVNSVKASMAAVINAPIDANALKQFCVDVENGQPQAVDVGLSAEKCLAFLSSYVERMLAGLKIERLRCLEDMKKHDMYSILWHNHTIGIAPPNRPRKRCRYCARKSYKAKSQKHYLCGYHFAAYIMNELGKPFPRGVVNIITRQQLEMLPSVLGRMTPEDKLITKITVPGVAEEFPLISVGDLVRLIFRDTVYMLATEVVAEVVDVVVKTEEVTLALPSPFQSSEGSSIPWTTMNSFPYLRALLRTQHYYLNASLIMQQYSQPNSIFNEQVAMPITRYVVDQCRFDVRFGFLGGRGFDVVAAALGEKIAPITSLGKNNRHREKISEQCTLLQRILAPAHALFNKDGVEYLDGKSPIPSVLSWATPVNREQQLAVTEIVHRGRGKPPYIINGPAGTGKTMCVVEAIVQILALDPKAKILVCAPSDAACDVLAKRLVPLLEKRSSHPDQFQLLRINWWARKMASLPPELLPCSCLNDQGVFDIPTHHDIRQASVVVCQCFVAESLETVSMRGWMRFHFSHLFIDESSQAMECEALIPMLKVGVACSIVLAGDPKQLGPIVRDPVAARIGLGISIQERLLSLPLYKSGKDSCIRLTGNYRSNEALLSVPSSLFYGGSLVAFAPHEIANLDYDLTPAGLPEFPLMLCNVAHGQNRNKLDTPSFYNLEECDAVLHLIQGLLNCTAKIAPDGKRTEGLLTGDIAVITPFRAQVLALRTVLRKAELGNVNVGVVEDFQGQEAKVVFISTVLTEEQGRWSRGAATADTSTQTSTQKLGFLEDPKRFNVAITRAHALCVIVGHASFLESSGTYWSALLDHIRRNDGVIGGGNDNDEEGGDPNDEDDIYGVADLMRRVEELRLLGAGCEEDQHDLAFYYTDTPQWKVMLS